MRRAHWLLVLLILTATQHARVVDAAAPERPNVLFIAVDDLNDWVSPFGGYEGIRTPAFQRLADRGMVFSRAYCAAPACNPSRAALMTGVRPATSGVYNNSQPWRPAMPNVVTLTEHFIAHGYEVHGGGKIFHSGTLKSIYNDTRSWQQYVDRSSDPLPDELPANGIAGTSHFDWGPVDAADADMGDTHTADWAVDYLAQEREQPFFLAVGLYKPHLPWYVPQKYFDQHPLSDIRLPIVKQDDLDDVPPIGVNMAKPQGDHRKVIEAGQWEEAVQGYLASITYADGQLGRVLDALDNGPNAENTIIVLWGDHGWHLGEKLHWRKFSLWEEATRVPLVFVVPGMTAAGSRCERTVSLLDLYPTLADLCGLPAVQTNDGKSLRPLLANAGAEWNRPVLTTHGRQNHAVRSERWRYIRYRDGGEELYDHQADPMEWTNLADDPQHAQVKRELAAWLPETDAADVPNEKTYKRDGGQRAKKPASGGQGNRGKQKQPQ